MLEIAARSVLVAFLAAICSGAPMAALLTWDIENQYRPGMVGGLMTLAVAANFVIGLPVALACYLLTDKSRASLVKLLVIANLIASTLTVLLAATGGAFAVFFYGLPTFVAANVFAIAGWFLVVKPVRAKAETRA